MNIHTTIVSIYQNYLVLNNHLFQLKRLDTRRVRFINFPECVSEYIVYTRLSQNRQIKRSIKVGDLEENINGVFKRIEIKCTTSDGPISFGPNEPWEKLYILRIQHNHYALYVVNLAHYSDKWKQIKVSKKETFEDHVRQKRRPRLTFKALRQQVQLQLIEQGNISDILK